MPTFEPKLVKIGAYLKLDDDVLFTIPEYQRAYSWGIDNCDKLWQDIINFIESGSKDRYFFGTIIINCYDNDKKFGLIDGQQRTITFLLLLKALLCIINIKLGTTVPNDNDSEGLMRGLQERRRRIMGILYKAETEDISDKPTEEDKKIYGRDLILKNYSINEQYKEDLKGILHSTDYKEAEETVDKKKYKQKDNRYTNFFRNFKFFYNKIIKLKSDSELNQIAKTILDNCELIQIKSWQVEMAITMFNSLNSDGLPLYDSDIIAARLFAEAEKTKTEKAFGDLWKELKVCIDDLEETGIGDINSILMQYMYYIRTVNKETIRNETGSVNVTTPGLRRYFTELNKEPVSDPIGMCSDMIRMAKIWKKISLYPQLKVLLKFNENMKLFLASYFLRFDEAQVTEEVMEPIMSCLLRLFALLELVNSGYSSKYFKPFLFKVEVKLADKEVSVDEITEDFDKHIRSSWEGKEEIRTALADYDGNALVYLNEYLLANEMNISFALGDKYDIEHIMPMSGGNLPQIRNDANIKDEEEFQSIVNKLGNKILLEEKINRAIGNNWFRTKVSTSLRDKTGYVDSKYPAACTLVNKYSDVDKPYWEKTDIEEATKQISERIFKFIFGE